MSGDIVNLRLARKRKARGDAEREAAANRARHGMKASERSLVTLERQQAEARLDGARLPDERLPEERD